MTYNEALETVREATRVFHAAQKAYRAREIGDAEFLAARKAYTDADLRFERFCMNGNRE
jgi:hypothetical protein